MTETEIIKPCPGCSKDNAMSIFDKRYGHVVQCLSCEMRGTWSWDDPHGCIKAWNSLPRRLTKEQFDAASKILEKNAVPESECPSCGKMGYVLANIQDIDNSLCFNCYWKEVDNAEEARF